MVLGNGIGVSFTKGGGATPFAMGNSLYTDGVNDIVSCSASSTAFNRLPLGLRVFGLNLP